MPGTLANLASKMASLQKAIPAFASDRAIEVAKTIHTALTETTPVDQGQAMSDWQPSLGAPSDATQQAYAPSPRGRMLGTAKGAVWTHTVDPDVTRANNIEAAQERFDIVTADKAPGETIYISNNDPYIVRLNEGSSLQAPAGFVDAAIVVGNAKDSQVKLTY